MEIQRSVTVTGRRRRLLLTSVGLAAAFLAASLALLAVTALAQSGSIEGTVTYYGSSPDTHTMWVSIYTDTAHAPFASIGVPSPQGPYSFDGLDDGTYYVYAYLDSDDSGGTPGIGEPAAWHDGDGDGYADPVAIVGESTIDRIDIALSDPWQPLAGLIGQVNDIAVHPTVSSTLYAAVGKPHSGADTRIYKSTDGATEWSLVYSTPVENLHALATASTVAYAVGEGDNKRSLILRSQDSDADWTEVMTGAGLQHSGGFYAVAISPATTSTAYAAGSELNLSYIGNGVVYRTVDSGDTWTRVLTTSTGSGRWANFYALAVNPATPTIVFAGGYESAGTSSHAVVYRSTDGGTSWTRVLSATEGTGQQFTALAVHPLTPTIVYAGSQTPKYVYRSSDGGDTWQQVRYERGFRLAIDPPSTVYAADDWRELDSSPSNGDSGTWAKVGQNTPGLIQSLAIDLGTTPSALYLGLRVEGIFRSTDGGLTWAAHNSSIRPPLDVRDVEVDPQDSSRLLVAAGWDGGWRSTDGGQTWTQVSAPSSFGSFAVNPQDSSIVFAGVFSTTTGGEILRSSDGGTSFSPVYTSAAVAGGGGGRVYDLFIAPSLTSTVYGAGQAVPTSGDPYGMVARSWNGGDSWAEVFVLANGTVEVVAVDPTDHATAYIGGQDCSGGPCTGFAYRTTDSGTTWTKVLTAAAPVRSLAVDPQKPHVLYASDEYTIYKSTDSGGTWSTLRSFGDAHVNRLVVDPRVPSHVYLAAPGHIAESINGGQTWSDYSAPINQGTESIGATALAVDGGAVTQTLYAGLGGAWTYTRLAPQPGSPVTVTAQTEGASAPYDGSTTVTALVVDEYENWASDGTVVTFTATSRGTFAGETFTTATTSDGRASVTLDGVTTGTVTVTVTSGDASGDTTVALRHFRFISETFVSGMMQPVDIDWATDGRMFVALKYGVVRVIEDGRLLPTPFIDISDEVNNYWDRGLLGIALHPSYPITPHVYLLYVYDPPELMGAPFDADGPDGGGQRVSRLIRVTAYLTDTNVADPSSTVVILGENSIYANIGDPADKDGEDGGISCASAGTPIEDCIPVDGPSHTIGSVRFGIDGSLFVSNGDSSPFFIADTRSLRALNVDSLAGKVMRIHPDTGLGYSDNPFYDGNPSSNRSRVWSMGLRNPFRFTVHPETNEPFVGDVGWELWEEINMGKGASFGWPCYEGDDAGSARQPLFEIYGGSVCQDLYALEPDGVDAPLYSYPHAGQGGAALAGVFYQGTAYPDEYQDVLFIADYNRDWIKYLTFDQSGDATAHDFIEHVSHHKGIVQLREAPDGSIYYAVINPGGEGMVRRLRYTDDPLALASALPSNGYPPLPVQFSSAGSSDPNDDASSLTYAWAFGDGGAESGPSPLHTYTVSGTYTALLTVTNSVGGIGTDSVVVVVGNLAPTATILAPIDGATYIVSQTVTFSGTAIDLEDGTVPSGDLAWEVLIHHNQHTHPNFLNTTGAGSSLVPPDHGDNSWLQICLTASDSGGLQGEDCVQIYPQTTVYTFTTDPPGLQLMYEGAHYTTPFTATIPISTSRSVSAPLSQAGLGFASWSDGGDASHIIAIGVTGDTLVANYRRDIWLPLLLVGYP
jgi:glucose/arabinose dehydrogenase